MNALRTSILFLMLYLIFAREITVGQFFSLWIYSFFIFGPLQELGSVINVYREAEEQPPRDLRAAAVRDPQSDGLQGIRRALLGNHRQRRPGSDLLEGRRRREARRSARRHGGPSRRARGAARGAPPGRRPGRRRRGASTRGVPGPRAARPRGRSSLPPRARSARSAGRTGHKRRAGQWNRGLDVYDPQRMGFVSEGEEAEWVGTPYDTTVQGNSNQGHFWGVHLPPQDKKALVEYLKTL